MVPLHHSVHQLTQPILLLSQLIVWAGGRGNCVGGRAGRGAAGCHEGRMHTVMAGGARRASGWGGGRPSCGEGRTFTVVAGAGRASRPHACVHASCVCHAPLLLMHQSCGRSAERSHVLRSKAIVHAPCGAMPHVQHHTRGQRGRQAFDVGSPCESPSHPRASRRGWLAAGLPHLQGQALWVSGAEYVDDLLQWVEALLAVVLQPLHVVQLRIDLTPVESGSGLTPL